MRLIATALVFLISQSVHAGIILSEDFEDGIADGWSLSGLWKVTQNAPEDGEYALGYVQNETAGATPNGDFQTGATNSGVASTPSLSCAGGPCIVSFDWFDISESSFWDIFNVSLLPSGGAAQTLIANGNSQTYLSFSQDISAAVGSDPFTIQFAFDTVDPLFNESPGVRVDNFLLQGGNPSSVPSPATVALFGLGLVGLGWSRRKRG